jgi:ABC-type lipoprotein release transport system permease subunit
VLNALVFRVSLVIIVTACLLAASIPAARAARFDPTLTLRQE